jgi:hypothetical protein
VKPVLSHSNSVSYLNTISLYLCSELSSWICCRVKLSTDVSEVRMMEAVRTPESSVDNHFTRQYIPEDNSEHHTRRRENLKSHKCVSTLTTLNTKFLERSGCNVRRKTHPRLCVPPRTRSLEAKQRKLPCYREFHKSSQFTEKQQPLNHAIVSCENHF